MNRYCSHCGRPFPSTEATAVQRKILRYLHKYRSLHGRAPSYQEIADHLEVAALSTVHEHLHTMADRGLVDLVKNKRRSVTPLVRLEEVH